MRFTETLIVSFSSLVTFTSANAVRFYTSNSCRTVFSGCENIGANVCCTTRPDKYAVSISKGPTDVGIGWSADNVGQYCEDSVCTGGGSGTLCCVTRRNQLPLYSGGSFYTIRRKMRGRSVDETKCTSTQEANVIGITVGDGRHWQISMSDKLEEKSAFYDLKAAFDEVDADKALEWLKENGAVLVTEESIIQTVEGSGSSTA